MLPPHMALHVVLEFASVRAVRALQSRLFATLVLLVAVQAVRRRVAFTALLAGERVDHLRPEQFSILAKTICKKIRRKTISIIIFYTLNYA